MSDLVDELWADTEPGPPSESAAPRTKIPHRPGPDAPPPTRNVIGRITWQSLRVPAGAFASALATAMLIFGRLTPLRGKVGFFVVFFVVYIAVYAALVSITDDRPAVIDRVMGVLMGSAAVLAGAALLSVIVYVLTRGFSALRHPNFYTSDLSVTGPLDPLEQGGISHAIIGTLITTGIALVITVPLGVACAVYLNETRSRVSGLVRTIVTAMTALPSILAGLFVFATWVLILGHERTGLAAAIAMSVMMLPIIIRSADVVLRLVPGSLREASAAMGAPSWRTAWHVVLPTARSGLTTSVILGVARGIGETAPVMLTAGYTATMNLNPLKGHMATLPLVAFELVRSPQPTQQARGFGAAAVLMLLVLVLFALARLLGGRPAGQLSGRKTKAMAGKSLRDMARIERRGRG